jgi:hypothetical protein
MTPAELIQAEVSLLLIKYGPEAVLSALAKRINQPLEQLRHFVDQLASVPVVEPKNTQKKAPKAFDLDSLLIAHPTKVVALKTLHARYLNRTFLPELRDVKRFLERRGHVTANPKSRVAAASVLFRMIAELPDSELTQLCEEPEHGLGTSSLGIISDEILRRNR